MVRLNRTYYSLLNFTSKIFQNWVFRANFKQIKQNPLNLPIYSANYAKLAPIINLFILCLRCLTSGRELPKIPANQTKFAQFAHKSPQITQNPHLLICALNKYFQIPDHKQSTPGNYSELRRFHTFRPQFP